MVALPDAFTSGATTADSASLTVSHTCAVGASILAVFVGTLLARSVSTLTYGGRALTLVQREVGLTNFAIELWTLDAPPSGANNVVVTPDASTSLAIGIHSWTVSAGQTRGAASVNNGTGTTATNAVASDAADIAISGTVIAAGATFSGSPSGSPNAATARTAAASTGGAANVRVRTSSAAGSGTETFTDTLSLTGPWAAVGASIQPPYVLRDLDHHPMTPLLVQ